MGLKPFGENDGPIAAHKFEVIFREGRGVPEVRPMTVEDTLELEYFRVIYTKALKG